MGAILGTAKTRDIGLNMDDEPTFDPNVGFSAPRKERVMIAKEEDLISARIPLKYRDYCAHLLLDYHKCRFKEAPWMLKCAHEKHAYLNCQHEDYIIRMKEFERERRLRIREKRIAKAGCA
ncbi:NADH dehydrogenase 1 beta subcomplex subunit 7 [Eumeta japonica]|uniref:NADH dehydrogenase [ubiquinone] 1 beta subcomplex subunit 7 n=1 Tax=Eumeta variegata TaxID=151549 RepID=A0A4C1UIK0_EUMVA|nr:NADH dehydrogenase 1 beta subcomplex subunit 7 [Eumeta japonica]